VAGQQLLQRDTELNIVQITKVFQLGAVLSVTSMNRPTFRKEDKMRPRRHWIRQLHVNFLSDLSDLRSNYHCSE